MGQYLVDAAFVPDRIICSPSRRTRETLDGLASTLSPLPEVVLVDALYADAEADYLPTLRRYGDDAASLLLIGHNSAIEETALLLAGNRDAPAYAAIREKFPTGALAILDFDGPWSALRAGTAELVSFVRPRDLAAGAPA